MLASRLHFACSPFQIPSTLQVAWPIAFGHRFVGATHASRILDAALPFQKGGAALSE